MGKRDDRSIEVEEGTEFTGKTIVGGRPRMHRKVRLNIPAGIEKTLYKAAVDADFRRMLLEDRTAAIQTRGLRLNPVETEMLAAIPDDRLDLIIDQIRPQKHGKRKFMKAVASAVVTLATGTAGVACDDGKPAPEDTTTDIPTDVHEVGDIIDGDMPDIPPDVDDTWDADEEEVPYDAYPEGSWGITPDVPPDPTED